MTTLVTREKTSTANGTLVIIVLIETLFTLGSLGLACWLRFSVIPTQAAKFKQQMQVNQDTFEYLCNAVIPSIAAKDTERALVLIKNNCLNGRNKNLITPDEHTALLNYAAGLTLRQMMRAQGGAKLSDAFDLLRQSESIKPTQDALELTGLTYCVQARQVKLGGQSDVATRAIQAFRKLFKDYPQRKGTMIDSDTFAEYCPNAVRVALYP